MSTENNDSNLNEYVTAMVGGQLFGLPIRQVQDVFIPDRLTRVPLGAAGNRRRAQSARPHRDPDRPELSAWPQAP